MRREHLILVALMLVVLATRLSFAFQVPSLSGDAAYFTLRQVNHITQYGMPITHDPLSYGGRIYFLQPLWYYVLAIPSLIFPPIMVLKVMPNLCMVLLIPLCFRLAKQFAKSPGAALAAAAIAAWVPATFQASLNDASSIALALPLLFFILERFMSGKWKGCVAGIILLALTHSVVVVLACVLALYAILLRAERIKIGKAEREIMIFTLLFTVWIHVLLFKNELMQYGMRVLWGAIPTAVLTDYFTNVSMLQVIGAVGYLPLLYGIYATLNTVFGEQQRKQHYLLLSLLLITTVALWLKSIPLRLGLPLLGIALSISFGHFLEVLGTYLERLHARWARAAFVIAIAVMMLFTSIAPAVLAAHDEMRTALRHEDEEAMGWLGDHTPVDAVVLARVEDGNIIAALANRATIADTQFHFAPNSQTRYEDLRRIFTTPVSTDALQLLGKYNVSYVYLSPDARKQYGGGLAFFNSNCFDLVHDEEVSIYAVQCTK